MMDFTNADMKFRSHFNDEEEEEYVSQSFDHSVSYKRYK